LDFRRAKFYKHKALLVLEVMLPSWHVPDRTARLCGNMNPASNVPLEKLKEFWRKKNGF